MKIFVHFVSDALINKLSYQKQRFNQEKFEKKEILPTLGQKAKDCTVQSNKLYNSLSVLRNTEQA